MKIDLSDVPDAEAEMLRDALTWSSGETLYIYYNYLTNAGVVALARFLPASNFKTIYLPSGVSDVGAIALAAAIPRSKLTELCLGGNDGITDAGARHLLAAVPYSNLRKVWLHATSVSESVDDAIRHAVAVRPTRNKLFLLLRLWFFFRFDGDNAMVHRVARFLLG